MNLFCARVHSCDFSGYTTILFLIFCDRMCLSFDSIELRRSLSMGCTTWCVFPVAALRVFAAIQGQCADTLHHLLALPAPKFAPVG